VNFIVLHLKRAASRVVPARLVPDVDHRLVVCRGQPSAGERQALPRAHAQSTGISPSSGRSGPAPPARTCPPGEQARCGA